jgi:hypothetical protein
MSALNLARLEFLKQTLMCLIVEEDLSWHVVWMYMMLFAEQYFMGVSVRGAEWTGWGDAGGLVRPREPRDLVPCVGEGVGEADGAGED